jgi:hypothetical protein
MQITILASPEVASKRSTGICKVPIFLSVLPLDTSSSGMQARVVTQWQSHSLDTAKALGDLSVEPY